MNGYTKKTYCRGSHLGPRHQAAYEESMFLRSGNVKFVLISICICLRIRRANLLSDPTTQIVNDAISLRDNEVPIGDKGKGGKPSHSHVIIPASVTMHSTKTSFNRFYRFT